MKLATKLEFFQRYLTLTIKIHCKNILEFFSLKFQPCCVETLSICNKACNFLRNITQNMLKIVHNGNYRRRDTDFELTL